jgi:heat shock protein HslJ
MIEALALAILLQNPSSIAPAPQPDPPPYAGDWTVEVIDNIKVLPESRVTIRIDGAGATAQVSGLAPCNNYRGTLTTAADGIRIRGIVKTMKACDPARMSEESDFFELLNQVSAYEVRPNDTLVLRTEAGKRITARRSTVGRQE